MTSLVRLGIALAFAGRAAVIRSLSTVIGAMLAALVMLTVFAVAGSQVWALSGYYGHQNAMNLLGAVVVATLLPIIVLLSVVSRLSASIRDRRLAALRLMGMGAGQTRVVAAVEVAVMSTVGTLLGALLFLAVRASTGSLSFAGDTDTQDPFRTGMPQMPPHLISAEASTFDTLVWVVVLVGIPVLTVAVSAAPTRRVTKSPLQLARQAETGRPSLLRLVPLLAGIGVLVWALRWPQAGPEAGTAEFRTAMAGIALTGLGLILAVPVLVRRLADVVARLSGRPAALVAARRTQLEPASTTRLAAGLLIGLYVAAGAQGVVASFEDTPQYKSAYRDLVTGPQVLSYAAEGRSARSVDLEPVVARAGLGQAHRTVTVHSRGAYSATITTCSALRAALPGLDKCSDAEPAWIYPPAAERPPPRTLRLSPWQGERRASRPALALPAPTAVLDWDTSYNTSVGGRLFVPSSFPGAQEMLADAPLTWLVVTRPGAEARNAVDRVIVAEHPSIHLSSWSDPVELANANRIRNIAWTVSGVVLAVGLAAFVIAAIDRSLERRREVAALHVLGAPTSLSWSSQLLQVLVPVGFGVPAAIGLGLLSGAALLALATARDVAPFDTVVTGGAIATLAALAAAMASTLGVPRRVSPELLRRE